MKENWREITDYKGLYMVSNHGRVKRTKKYLNSTDDGILKPVVIKNMWPKVSLSKNNTKLNFYIHTLVAEAFIGARPEGFVVNHIDGDKQNNHVSNLEYISVGDNNRHAFFTGLNNCIGEQNPASKLTELEVNEIRQRYCITEISYSQLAYEYGISKTQIGDILKGKSWTHTNKYWLKRAKNKKRYSGKLSKSDIKSINKLIGVIPKNQIAKRFGVSPQAIRKIEIGDIHAGTV